MARRDVDEPGAAGTTGDGARAGRVRVQQTAARTAGRAREPVWRSSYLALGRGRGIRDPDPDTPGIDCGHGVAPQPARATPPLQDNARVLEGRSGRPPL